MKHGFNLLHFRVKLILVLVDVEVLFEFRNILLEREDFLVLLMKPRQLMLGSLDIFVELTIPIIMHNERKPCLPAISRWVVLSDPCPSVGVGTSCLQHLVHQFIIVLKLWPSRGI